MAAEYYFVPDRRKSTVRVYVNSVEIHSEFFRTVESRKEYINFMKLLLQKAGFVYFDISFSYFRRKGAETDMYITLEKRKLLIKQTIRNKKESNLLHQN